MFSSEVNGWLWVGALSAMNVVNYMDRYTLAGILTDVQSTFQIDNKMGGFLQTIFVLFYTVFALICGYLADRHNRKLIMICGMTVWTASIFASAFVPSTAFPVFLLLRGIGGIGEASFSVSSPTVISDLFETHKRSRVFMIFFFAIPLGSGIGYVYGSKMAAIFGDWRWSLRITPIFGLIIIVFLILMLREPNRIDVSDNSKSSFDEIMTSTQSTRGSWSLYLEDLMYLVRVKSYVWLCVSYAMMMFAIGTLAWWIPTVFMHATAIALHINDTNTLSDSDKNDINWIFGLITTISGIIGILIGVWLTRWWKKGRGCFARFASQKADAYVAAIGSVGAVPFLSVAYLFLPSNIHASWVFIAIGFVFLCVNWAIVVDMLMYIIVPEHRNVATSWFLLFAHLLGDASGPFVVGSALDWWCGDDTSPRAQFTALIYTFHVLNALIALSVITFLLAAYYATNVKPPSENNSRNCSRNSTVNNDCFN